MVEVPVGVEAAVEMVRVVEQVGEHVSGENAAVASVGNPEAEKDTDCVVPETSVALMELETWSPWLTDLLPPFASEKLKEVVAGFTVKLKLVVLVTPPPVPVTVMVEVPVGVDDVVEIVSPLEQVGVHAVGENTAVAPEGNPEAEKATDCAVPETSVALMVLETWSPWVTDLLPPFAREKLKEVVAGFTVKLKLVVLVTAPPMPVTVMVEVPVGVDDVVEIVRPLEQVGVHAVGENDAVAPVGSPEAEKATACAVPDTSAALMELATEAPWFTDLLPPFVSAKLNAAGAPRSFLMVT